MAFKLPSLPPFGMTGSTELQQQVWWKQFKDKIEGQVNDILDVQADILAAQADIITAQTTASAVQQQNAISSSWTVPGLVLNAADAGSDVTVTVAAHTRYYDDGTSVSVGGGSFTGQPYSTPIAVYYDDPTRADTTPPYQITTNLALAQANQAVGRHRVGALTTPGAGAPPTSGGSTPPGSSSHGPDYEIP